MCGSICHSNVLLLEFDASISLKTGMSCITTVISLSAVASYSMAGFESEWSCAVIEFRYIKGLEQFCGQEGSIFIDSEFLIKKEHCRSQLNLLSEIIGICSEL
jgi:hypothetical protein